MHWTRHGVQVQNCAARSEAETDDLRIVVEKEPRKSVES